MIFSIYNISYLKHYKHNLCFPVKYTKNNFFFKVEKNIDKQHVFVKDIYLFQIHFLLFQMQKLIFLALIFTLATVYARRPNYAKQGRSPLDACRLDCIYDAVMCGAPCRLLFRSHRQGYFNCASDCSRDRKTCFFGCDKKVSAPEPVVAAATTVSVPVVQTKHGHMAEADGKETGDSDESIEDQVSMMG